jgi:hypothetical protein
LKSSFALIKEGWVYFRLLLGQRAFLGAYVLCLGGFDVISALQAGNTTVQFGLQFYLAPSLTTFMKVFVLLLLSGRSPVFATRTWGDLWRVWASLFVAGLYVLLGLLCFIIPGIILAFRYWYVSEAVVLEHRSLNGALARSRQLAALNSGRTFLSNIFILLVLYIFAFLASFLVSSIDQSAVESFTFNYLLQLLGSASAVWIMCSRYAGYLDASAKFSSRESTESA